MSDSPEHRNADSIEESPNIKDVAKKEYKLIEGNLKFYIYQTIILNLPTILQYVTAIALWIIGMIKGIPILLYASYAWLGIISSYVLYKLAVRLFKKDEQLSLFSGNAETQEIAQTENALLPPKTEPILEPKSEEKQEMVFVKPKPIKREAQPIEQDFAETPPKSEEKQDIEIIFDKKESKYLKQLGKKLLPCQVFIGVKNHTAASVNNVKVYIERLQSDKNFAERYSLPEFDEHHIPLREKNDSPPYKQLFTLNPQAPPLLFYIGEVSEDRIFKIYSALNDEPFQFAYSSQFTVVVEGDNILPVKKRLPFTWKHEGLNPSSP